MGVAQSRAANAAAENDVARLQEIAAAHPQALLRQSLWKQRSALHAAARAGATEALCAVLDVAAHRQPGQLLGFLNAPDYAGNTALSLACRSGYVDCCRELLEAGSSPLPANSQGWTPLHHAAAHGHAACIHLLLSTTVRLADGSRCPAGQAPVPDVVDLERYIDTRNHSGLCALHLAVLNGSQASASELVNHGAQLDTPLLTMGFRSAPFMVHACLGPGSTALHMAAATGRLPLCVLILHAQQQRHPGLELRRLRNVRGMTPLNTALVCGHRNLASLLTAGAPVPPPPAPPRGRAPSGHLPPLLRQQLLALVHRAALLNQLRELGLGGSAAEAAPMLPGLAAGPIARLESLLHSESATAAQVLAVVDEMLDEAAAAAGGGGSSSAAQRGTLAGPAAAGSGGSGGSGSYAASRGMRRRLRRLQQERQQAAAQLAAAQQGGVDWTLLERNRSLWHAEHAGPSLYRRLHRRQDRQRQAQAAAQPAAEGASSSQRREQEEQVQALMLAGELLEPGEGSAGMRQGHQLQLGGPGSTLGSGTSSSSSSSSSAAPTGTAAAAAAAGDRQQLQEQPLQGQQGLLPRQGLPAGDASSAAAVPSRGQADAICPVCLDLPADIAIAPCGHRACLGCCGRLAAYCASGSSTSFGLPATGPLCPLCRAPIEAFRRVTE